MDGATLLPVQYFGPTREVEGIRLLMAAVLEDALHLLRYEAGAKGMGGAAAEAWDWLHREDVRSPFAFVRICEALGLDALGIRRTAHAPRPRRRVREPDAVRESARGEVREC